jgi:hypothetical protein
MSEMIFKSKEDAIKELGCEEKCCKHYIKDSVWSFCDAIFTDDMCWSKKEIFIKETK